MRFSKSFKGILSVLGANIFVMAVGVIQSLLLPSILGPEEYGYWSMYLLYIGYAGFFNLGIADGIYLIYGGSDYETLDKSKFKSYFLFSISYLTTLCVIWFAFCFFAVQNEKIRFIMMLIGLSSWLACLISLTVMVDQATLRFSIYSKGHIIEKLFIMIGTFLLYIINSKTAVFAIVCSIIGRIVTVIYYYSNSKPIVTAKALPISSVYKDIKIFASAGIWLTLASVGTSAMTNIGRSFVQSKLGVVELGYYSFVFSIMGLFTLFFSAIATVLFPVMKKATKELYYEQMLSMDKMLDWFAIIVLLLYFPAKIVLGILYPQYATALHCLIVVFPIAILLGKMSMVYITSYKIERMEKEFVYILCIAVIICIGLNAMFLKIYQDIIASAIATYIAFLIWSFMAVYVYNRRTDKKYGYALAPNIITILCVCINVLIVNKTVALLISYIIIVPASIFYSIRIKPVLGAEIKRIKG